MSPGPATVPACPCGQSPAERRRSRTADASQGRAGAIAAAAPASRAHLRLHGDVELVRECEARQREAHAPRLSERDAEVLDEVLDEEAARRGPRAGTAGSRVLGLRSLQPPSTQQRCRRGLTYNSPRLKVPCDDTGTAAAVPSRPDPPLTPAQSSPRRYGDRGLRWTSCLQRPQPRR